MTFTYSISEHEKDKITFDYDEEGREQIDCQVQAGSAFIFANREGMVTLAKLLLKMAYGSYSEGFHIHLHKNFDADRPEVLSIGLVKNEDILTD